MDSFWKIRHVFKATYFVTDSHIIKNTLHHNVSYPHLRLIYTIKDEYILSSYLIQTSKLSQVTIFTGRLESYECIIYDGPGITVNMLKSQPVQKCSTFQCLIFLLKQSIETRQINYFLKFSTKFLYFTQISRQQYFLENLPNINCLPQICVISIHSSQGYHVSATVSNMFVTDFEDNLCIHCGMVTGEKMHDDNKQSGPFCTSQSDTLRSFYSHNFSLILVLYWYKHYNTINMFVITNKMSSCKN